MKTGDRGRLCRLHAASDRDDCLHAYFCDSGARLDAPCGFYDRVCYQKYTHRQHLATLEESARGDSEGDRHHQWAAGNSLVRDSELSCNGPEGKAQPCTPNSGCSLSQDASARLTRSQVAKTDNKLCFLPTRLWDKESQRQSPKALELSGDPCIEACSTLPLERRMSGCYWRSISTCPYLIWLSKK